MPNKYSVNRKLFHKGHWEIIAARFREALVPFVEINTFEPEGSEAAKLELASKSAARFALIDLAMELARRFKLDNDEFVPEMFLDRCSPDPDLHPLSELWVG
jgi:hypothetical protein